MKKNLPSNAQYISALKGNTKTVHSLHVTTNFNESTLPENLENWLGKLSLLYGVPFEHLVPNSGMLPKESLRFFYVDPNWTNSMLDGALSIGSHSSRDTAQIEAVYTQLQQNVQGAMQMVRRKIAKAEMPETVTTDLAVSGLLIRSQLISGWPGLEILAYEDYTIDTNNKAIPTNKIPALRMERLAPDVMLCLYAKMPKMIAFNEPKEGLSFGCITDSKEKNSGFLIPRYMGYHVGQPVGQPVGGIAPENKAKIAYRSGDKGVIDINGTKTNLIAILKKHDALSSSGDLSPADMGLQLIKSAEQQQFLSGYTPTTPNPKDCIDY
ncbi:hypothetical protein [Aquimarina muelleri]|uniref:Uncharacterized protein n=1 Tax=Aquimarina muelleri TaxID=279356 RepID=A0A918N3J7_9FLAO|nr:hypothetical protein [Aquimarina muelleri]MCX2761509.1 hypothetical protein [Aquimarina muelleri]GGX14245.1 hypothetical protein GCM10007384_14820 [Aquimarina muelleri]